MLSLALISFLAFITLGCGDSNNDFVVTGNNNNNPGAQTGSLTFNFLAPQAIQAPDGTTDVRFDLFDGPNGTGNRVDTVTVDFQTTIVLTEVSPSVESVLITFIIGNGIPVQTQLGNVSVVAGTTTVADLTTFTAGVPVFEELTVTPGVVSLNVGGTQPLTVVASFSNGFEVNLSGAGKGIVYAEDGSDHVTVSSAGVITGTNPGFAEVSVSLTTNGTTIIEEIPVTVTSTVDGTFEITPAAVSEAPGETTTNALVATFTPTGGTASNVIADVDFVSNNPDVTVNANGTINIAPGAALGDTATLTGTYTDGDGDDFTDVVAVTVAPDVVASISINPTAVTLPSGGFRYDLQVSAEDANGDPIDIASADLNSESSNPTAASVDGLRVTTGTAGASTVTVRTNANSSIFASIAVTTVNATVDEITLSQDEFDMYISQGIPIVVTAELSTGQIIADAQNSPDLDVVVGSDFATIVDGELRALEITSAFPFTPAAIQIGFVSGGDTAPADITVREVQLTSVEVSIGGITDPDNEFLLPEDHNALFQVAGTFEDGSSRPLQVGEEYELLLGGMGGVIANEPGTVNPFLSTLSGNVGETKTYIIDLRDDIQGDLDAMFGDISGDMEIVSGEASSLTVDFAEYPDDHRLLCDGTGDKFDRVIVARADFPGLPGFRISGFDSAFFISNDASLNVNGPDTSIEGWPCIASDVPAAADDVTFTLDETVDVNAVLEDVSVLIPDVLTTRPQGVGNFNGLVVDVGGRLTFQTVVDYGDGEGLVNRSLDYPVLESTFDFVRDVWATLDFANGSTTYFFKISSLDHTPQLFLFNTRDAEGDLLPAIGTGSATSFTVDAARNL